ncbi:hypothetical protein FACS189428_0210 [Clostridia bacterium]|nr:hypothetical protein FACS189428_0210 [Clostridia bacterium]
MKKMMILMLTLLIWGSASMNSQVLIGSQLEGADNPTPGSILDLQSDGSLGLLMPSVTLEKATQWAPVTGSAVEGMTVFNNSNSVADGLTGKGIYVWANNEWSRMGASATPCVAIVATSPKTVFTGAIGSGQTLEVSLTGGTAPFNYNWTKDGTLLQTKSNVSEFEDSYLATEYGTYTCKITNGCSQQTIAFTVSAVSVGEYGDTPPENLKVSWALNGVTCFDVTAGEPFPGSSQYTVTAANATINDIIWLYEGADGVLTGQPGTGNPSVTLPFASQSAVSTLAGVYPNKKTVTVTALITLTANGTQYKVNVTKVISFQNQSCCDGAIIYDAAWNYVSGSLPGDGAKVGGADATTDKAWSPNITTTTGSWSATALDSHFTNANVDLCVYKTNANSGNTTTWANAVNNCANGNYADGDATVGWYLPNERELQSIYQAIGGNGSSAVNFANLTPSTGTIATTAENMVSNRYWSSTETAAAFGLSFNFNGGGRSNYGKTGNFSVRCVRRL